MAGLDSSPFFPSDSLAALRQDGLVGGRLSRFPKISQFAILVSHERCASVFQA
jgi:hypothetical protein